MKMTKWILLAALAASSVTFAASPAATQDWTRHYVSTSVWSKADNQDWVRTFVATNIGRNVVIHETISTNTGFATYCYTNFDGNVITMKMGMRDKLALVVSNCSNAAILHGITNGTLFAWDGAADFRNEEIGRSIYNWDQEHYSYNGILSVTNGVREYIPGYFDIYGTRIDRETSERLTSQSGAEVESAWSRFFRVIAAILIPSAKADTWGGISGWVHTPMYQSYYADYLFDVTDTRGNVATIEYKNGKLDIDTLNKALSDLKYSVGDVFGYLAFLVEDVIALDQNMQQTDEELTDLQEKLNDVFAEVFGKLKEIEQTKKSPDGNGTQTEPIVIVQKTEKQIILASEGFAAAGVDNRTIEVKNAKTPQARYQLMDYPSVNGKFPYSVAGNFHMGWFKFADAFDDKSIAIDKDSATDMPSKAGDKHGVHVAGWYKPSTDPYKCDDTVASMLTNATEDTSHYFLTRYGNDGQVHYTRAGNLKITSIPPVDRTSISTNETGAVNKVAVKGTHTAANANKYAKTDGLGNITWDNPTTALKVKVTSFDATTDERVIGSGPVTNLIHFTSANDAAIKYNLSEDGANGVSVQIGVYYK